MKSEAPPSLKTDIYRYEIAERRVWRVTNTPDEGEFSPAVMLRTGKAEQVTVDIGRSLQRMPSGSVSFVQRGPAGVDGTPSAMIRHLLNKTIPQRETISTAPLVRPAAGASDPFLAWTPDGTLLMAAGSTVYQWRTGDPSWSVVADLGAFGLREVSRLTVSPKGHRIAIVALAR